MSSIIDQLNAQQQSELELKEMRGTNGIGALSQENVESSSRDAADLATDSSDEDSDYDDDSDYTYESEQTEVDLEKQWKDIVTQFNGLVFLVIIPYGGRVIGRKFAHALWERVADLIFP